jgi:hypothetical protein
MTTANNSKDSIRTGRTVLFNLVQYAVLLLFVILYVYNISRYFWTLPAPSDPLQYLGSASWGTTWAYFPWLDRISLAVNLRLISLIFSKAYIGGMVYIGIVNTAILIASMYWAFKKSGYWAALLAGIFINTSFLMLGWSTYIYPDQTVALYALLAYIMFFRDSDQKRFFGPILLAGTFAALTSLTKITGIIVPVFFIGYCILKGEWKNLIRLLSGIIIGSLLIVFLFIVLFNWQSFVNTFQHFFSNTISHNIATGTDPFGAAYFHEFILSIKYFPFIALFFAAGAYINKNSKNLFLLAWLNILLVCIVRMLAPSIPTYIYPAYVFTCLGLSVYLADLIKPKNEIDTTDKSDLLSNLILIVTSTVALILIIRGMQFGFTYGPVKVYDYGYNYLKPFDVYTSNNLVYASSIKRLYSFSPFILLGAFAYILATKRKIAIVLFILITSFLCSFLNGGLAYKKAIFDREEAGFFYKNAPLLNKVPAKTFSVYVESWNKHNWSANILWIYRLFFDEKYERVFEPKYKSQYLNEYEVIGNIAYIKNEEDLASDVRGSILLTDKPGVVYKYFPNALKIKSDELSTQNLVLLDISNKTVQKKTLFTFDLDLRKWKGTNYDINMDNINKVLPPLQIVGVRGDFKFIYNPMHDKSIMRIVMKKANPSEQSLINFGYWMQSEIGELTDKSNLYLTFNIELNLSKAGGSHTLFIQDQVKEDWQKITIPLDQNGFKEYTLTKELRSDISTVIAGINFVPQTADDWIEIKKFNLTIWTKLQDSD